MGEGERVNLLLVDNDPAKLLSYEAMLRELGEHLITARSGREALQHLLNHEIAVIVLDVQMPEMDGFALAQLIRAHPRYQETAMIFLSAALLDASRPTAGVRRWRGGLSHGALHARAVTRESPRLRGALSVSASTRARAT